MVASEDDFGSPNLVIPHVPDISDRPTRDSLNKAVQQHQCAYLRCSHGENPNLLIVFMTFFGKLGVDLLTLVQVGESAKYDILVIGDTRRDFLLQGVEKWDMSIFESVAAITRFAEDHDKEVIDVIGHSAGAITALTYAPLMKVRRCIVFEPRTLFSRESMELDFPFADIAKNVYRLVLEDNVLKLPEDQREQFLRARNWVAQARYDTQFQVHYAQGNMISRAHARDLSDLPNVTLHTYDYRKHNLTNYLHQEGQLADVLLSALSSEPVEAE